MPNRSEGYGDYLMQHKRNSGTCMCQGIIFSYHASMHISISIHDIEMAEILSYWAMGIQMYQITNAVHETHTQTGEGEMHHGPRITDALLPLTFTFIPRNGCT